MVHHDRTNEQQPMKTDQPTATAASAASIDSTIDTAAADNQPLVSGSSSPCSMGMKIKSEASGISSSSASNSNPLIVEQELDQHESNELQPKKQDQEDISMYGDARNDEYCNVIISSSELLGIDHPSGAAPATAETRCRSTDRCNNQTVNDVSEDEDGDHSQGGYYEVVAPNEAIATTTDDVSNLGNDLVKNCHILEPQVQAATATSTKHQTFGAAPCFDDVHKEDKNIANKTTTLIITTTEDHSNSKRGEATTATSTAKNATSPGNSKNQQQQSSCPPGHIYALRDIIIEKSALEHNDEQKQSNAPPQDRGSSTLVSSSPQDCLTTKDNSINEELPLSEKQENHRVESCPPRPSAVVFEETSNNDKGQQQLPTPRIVTSHVVRTSEAVYRQLETMSAGTVLCPTSCLAVPKILETMGLLEENKEIDYVENTSTNNEYVNNEWLQFRASLVVGTSSKSTTSPVSLEDTASGECLEHKTHMQDKEYYKEEQSSSSSLLIAAVSSSAIKKKMESKFVDVSIKYPFSCNVGGGEGGDAANKEEEGGQTSPSGAYQSRGASKKKKKKLRRFFHSMNCLGNRRKNIDRDGAASEVSTGAVVSHKGLDGVTKNNIHEGTNPTAASNSRPKMIITNGVIDWENSNLNGNCCHILSHSCSFVAYSASDAESLMATGADGGNSGVRGGGRDKDNKATMMTMNTVTTTPLLHTNSLGATIFGDTAVIHNTIRPINEIVCVDESLGIYISESGLSASDCQNIINTSEFCASNRGGWSSYTYAKQTLGCRENDQLAFVCARPVMTACATIRKHLMAATTSNDGGVNEASNATKCNGNDDNNTSCELNRPIRRQELVLDVREPHVVKYDTSRVERQKLDMHTDKSEWTFLIALSEGRGQDYKGGGTYFQTLNSTVHLQRGQMVIFRGKLRHSGVQIRHGCRYLLVGFLVPATKTAAASK